MMVKDITAPDEHTVVIQLKFATSALLPALADRTAGSICQTARKRGSDSNLMKAWRI